MGIFDTLTKLIEKQPANPLKERACIIGGGRSGKGKTFLAANLACGLAHMQRKVVLIDADISKPELHTHFDIKLPKYTFDDFINNKAKRIKDIMVSTPIKNLSLITGATEILNFGNPDYGKKDKLIKTLKSIDAENIIIDLSSTETLEAQEFFSQGKLGIIVTSPAPDDLTNTNEFLKLCLHRRIINLFNDDRKIKTRVITLLKGKDKAENMKDFVLALREIDEDAAGLIEKELRRNLYGLVVNVANESEAHSVHEVMSNLAQNSLRINLPLLGYIPLSENIVFSIIDKIPIITQEEATEASEPINKILNIVFEKLQSQTLWKPSKVKLFDTGEEVDFSDVNLLEMDLSELESITPKSERFPVMDPSVSYADADESVVPVAVAGAPEPDDTQYEDYDQEDDTTEKWESIQVDLEEPTVTEPPRIFVKPRQQVVDEILAKTAPPVKPKPKHKKPIAKDARVAMKTKDTMTLETGLNEDIKYNNRTIHIQTEDLGNKKAEVMTLVYEAGQILFSKISTYQELKIQTVTKQMVQERLTWQHNVIKKGIIAGKLDDKIIT